MNPSDPSFENEPIDEPFAKTLLWERLTRLFKLIFLNVAYSDFPSFMTYAETLWCTNLKCSLEMLWCTTLLHGAQPCHTLFFREFPQLHMECNVNMNSTHRNCHGHLKILERWTSLLLTLELSKCMHPRSHTKFSTRNETYSVVNMWDL